MDQLRLKNKKCNKLYTLLSFKQKVYLTEKIKNQMFLRRREEKHQILALKVNNGMEMRNKIGKNYNENVS